MMAVRINHDRCTIISFDVRYGFIKVIIKVIIKGIIKAIINMIVKVIVTFARAFLAASASAAIALISWAGTLTSFTWTS